MTDRIKKESTAIIKDTPKCFTKFEDNEVRKKHLPVWVMGELEDNNCKYYFLFPSWNLSLKTMPSLLEKDYILFQLIQK